MGRLELKNGDKVLVEGEPHVFLFEKGGDAFVCSENEWYKDSFMIIAKSYSMDKVVLTNM